MAKGLGFSEEQFNDVMRWREEQWRLKKEAAAARNTPAQPRPTSKPIPPNSVARGPGYVYRRTPYYNMMQNGSAYSFDYGQPTYNDLRRTRNNNDSGPIPSAYLNYFDR